MSVTITEDVFGRLELMGENGNNESRNIKRFTLQNENGMIVQIINYGATITSIKVPDKNGHIDDVVLGFDTIQEYQAAPYYFGATIGRFCNRIAGGIFRIGTKEFQLTRNENGVNHLHGGSKGFDKVIWEGDRHGDGVVLTYRSLSGEEGYPGDVTATVVYSLSSRNELKMDYKVAEMTEVTPINLTNHSYFNLAGHGFGSLRRHILQIEADHYLPVNDALIPTGERRSVEGTVFDLRRGIRLDNLDGIAGGGYDHNFCLPTSQPLQLAAKFGKFRVKPEVYNTSLREKCTTKRGKCNVTLSNIGTFRARVLEETSGRSLRVLTTQPGVQFYTSNFLPSDESLVGKESAPYKRHSAFCLETQNYPDTVNKKNFPDCLYGPGQCYEHTTIYHFSTS